MLRVPRCLAPLKPPAALFGVLAALAFLDPLVGELATGLVRNRNPQVRELSRGQAGTRFAGSRHANHVISERQAQHTLGRFAATT